MRQELRDALSTAWLALGEPGVWWTGAERVKIAGETRAARSCSLCGKRKVALSPHATPGSHRRGERPRPSRPFIASFPIPAACRRRGITGRRPPASVTQAYVELLSVVAITTAVDTFDRASGAPLRPLPAPLPDRPTQAAPCNVHRALSLVAMMQFWDMFETLYLPQT